MSKGLLLIRDSYGVKHTFGKIKVGANVYHTLERPWIRDPAHPGGMAFESCVPDGTYRLVPHTRPSGEKVVALVNEDLGVWYRKEDRINPWGRYLILIHSANYVDEIVGCIAPGRTRTIYQNKNMVTSSRQAMGMLNVRNYKTLTIQTTTGAKD